MKPLVAPLRPRFRAWRPMRGMGTVAGNGGEHLVGPVATLIGRDVPRAPQSPRPPWRWDAGAAHEGAMNSCGLDIASMTPQERLSLLDALWDSLAATPEAILLTRSAVRGTRPTAGRARCRGSGRHPLGGGL